ncbi:insecticidal delta-endotoxin Cry8Ea1 family protein [Bacillus mycoides]|uniref:insecticidal delta-endotoxin Cry8Ea1 family protein n=1 Tax=Bacillus mycoides TaxID=1405 RepID=UPI00257F3F20|nr:insecticidal delta-endotoxin Cry8Ea1 family protein [Bacillus mycoides]
MQRELQLFAREQALRQLEGLGNNLNLYREAFREWEQDRNNPSTRNRVIDRFRIMDAFLTQYIPVFRINNYQVQLLSVYAQAANIHLLLLRDATVFGSDWGLTSTNINDIYNRQMNLIAEYTNHCTTWYNNGLNEARNLSRSSWDTFNNYRRDMTIMVLDLIALFPTYDQRRYPITTKLELTREIYTPAIASQNWSNFNHLSPNIDFAFYERNLIRPPSLFTWLDRTEMFSRNLSVEVSEVWGGHINYFHHTRSLAASLRSNFIGSDQRRVSQYNFNFVGDDIFRVDSLVGSNTVGNFFGVIQGNFHLVNRSSSSTRAIPFTTRSTNPSRRSIVSELPGENSNSPNFRNYTHRLSWISGAFIGSDIANVLAYGWTHRSVDPNNTILPNRITQIPAVKATTISNATVVSGPGSTGGNLVRLHNQGRFQIQMNFPTPQTNYRIRIRYASIGSRVLHVQFSGANHGPTIAPTTVSLDNLRYENFAYIDVIGTFIPALGNYVTIVNPNPGDVVIDKIEFIPIGTFANQSLGETEVHNNNYNQSYNNYDQNMDNMYPPSYNNVYEQNSHDSYDSGYNNTYEPNYDCNCNQKYNNNYNQNSGCTCNQGYNSNYPK